MPIVKTILRINKVGKILITGANGQVGMEFKQLSASFPLLDFVFLQREDMILYELNSVKSVFAIHQPKYCINCAAYTAVDKAETEKEEAYRVNGDAPGILADVCKYFNTKFIHLSTDYVFDGIATVPYKEDFLTDPQNVYGASKLEGEKRVFLLNQDAIVIRTSWVYSEFGKNFVKTMLRLMKEKPELNVVNDQKGSPTYAADLAAVIMQLVIADKWQPGTYHYANEGEITWYDFAVAIKELTGSSCIINPITTAEFPTPARRPAYSVLDTTKIEGLGIKLKYWKDSLQQCLLKLS